MRRNAGVDTKGNGKSKGEAAAGKEGKAGEVFESEQFDNPVHGQDEGKT